MVGKNNVMNIRSSKSRWLGLTGETRGFCDFESVACSVRAAYLLMFSIYPRRYKAKTLQDCINIYCPVGDGDNNPSRYCAFVCDFSFVDPTTPVSSLSLHKRKLILSAMAIVENSYALRDSDFSLISKKWK